MSGTTNIVANRSFLFRMVLVAIILGMAHAKPPTKGIMERPFNPNLRITLSLIKLARTI